jgi:purine-binding chemotaxis protein CheW
MDIAKIRKKLKKFEKGGRTGKEVPPVERPVEQELGTTSPAQEQSAEPGPAGPGAEEEKVPQNRIEEFPASAEKQINTEAPESGETEETEGTEEIIEILTFGLMKQEFAFRISHLEEILRMQRITKLPKVPDYVLGITSLRGKIIPVMDLKSRLSLAAEPSEKDHKGKILIVKGPRGPIGIVVDKVIGVVRIEKSGILPPPSHFSEEELRFIDGVAVVDRRFVSIVNMEEAVALHLK